MEVKAPTPAVILSVAKDLLSEAGSQTGRVDPSAVGLRMT
jgi:hypothetical protein